MLHCSHGTIAGSASCQPQIHTHHPTNTLLTRLRVVDDVADGELLKSFELSRQKYKKRKEQVGGGGGRRRFAGLFVC